jgi:hypothetical protein
MQQVQQVIQQAMHRSYLQNPADERYIQPSYMHDEDFDEIEAHVKNLKKAVEEFRDCSSSASPGVGRKIREAADGLCLKAEVILWRLEGAKHFTYPARQVLWEDIRTAIASFEEAAEPMVSKRV